MSATLTAVARVMGALWATSKEPHLRPPVRLPTASQALGFSLSLYLHLMGLFVLWAGYVHLTSDQQVVPPSEPATIELTLLSSDNAMNPDGAQGQTADAATVTQEAPPTLPLPQPAESVPLPEVPEKPSFADALAPAPTPAPDTSPAPTLALPVRPAPASVSSADAHVAVAAPPPSNTRGPASGNGDAQNTTLQSLGGGGNASGRVDAHPSLERAIKPNYPISARRRGEEGTVVIDVAVSPEGQASDVRLVATSGFSELDAAAQRAVSQARFKPGTRDGKSIASSARLTIIFRLRDQ